MRYRSLALAIAAFSSMHVASADAQSVYVAPGGVYIGAGPVYVIPAPNNGAAPYVTPSYGYGPPTVVAPPPAVVAPTAVYGPNGGYYNGGYYNGGYYNGGYNGGYYEAPLSAYAAEVPPRPPAVVPYYGGRRCVDRFNGYGQRWSCY
jgi:hypothetical protein